MIGSRIALPWIDRAPARRRRAMPRRLSIPLRRPRLGRRPVALLAATLALLGGGWLWLRDSSLVAVEHVRISGLSGPGAERARIALRDAALNMTTLHVRLDALRAAAAPFPLVKALHASANPPHGLRITVTEQIPVAAATLDGRRVAVAGDGTLLPALGGGALATLPLHVASGSRRVSAAWALRALAALTAAPQPLRPRVGAIGSTPGRGLTFTLRAGPRLYFGASGAWAAKWAAAASVLADPSSAGAAYIDVSVPERPAAGGVAGAAGPGGSSTAPAAPPGPGAAPAPPAPGALAAPPGQMGAGAGGAGTPSGATPTPGATAPGGGG